jgi:hypothetical protein
MALCPRAGAIAVAEEARGGSSAWRARRLSKASFDIAELARLIETLRATGFNVEAYIDALTAQGVFAPCEDTIEIMEKITDLRKDIDEAIELDAAQAFNDFHDLTMDFKKATTSLLQQFTNLHSELIKLPMFQRLLGTGIILVKLSEKTHPSGLEGEKCACTIKLAPMPEAKRIKTMTTHACQLEMAPAWGLSPTRAQKEKL